MNKQNQDARSEVLAYLADKVQVCLGTKVQVYLAVKITTTLS